MMYIIYGPLANGATTLMFEGVQHIQMQAAFGKLSKNIRSIFSTLHPQLFVH